MHNVAVLSGGMSSKEKSQDGPRNYVLRFSEGWPKQIERDGSEWEGRSSREKMRRTLPKRLVMKDKREIGWIEKKA